MHGQENPNTRTFKAGYNKLCLERHINITSFNCRIIYVDKQQTI
jgi:hypothetical protein